MELATKVSFTQAIGASLRRDVLFLPALVIALVGTGYVIFLPPAWLARVPTAIVDIASGEREELAIRAVEAEQARAALDAQLTDGQAELEQVRSTLQRLRETAATHEAAASALGPRVETLEQQLAKREVELARLQAEAKRTAQALERAGSDAEALRRENARLDQALQTTGADDRKAQLVEAQQLLQAAETARAWQADTISALRDELGQRQTDVATLNATLRAAASEKEALAAQTTALRGELGRMAQRLAATEAQLQEGAQALTRREDEVARLTTRTEASATQVRDLRAELADARDQLASARNAIGQLSESLTLDATELARLDSIEAQNGLLRAEIEAAETDLAAVTEDLGAAQRELEAAQRALRSQSEASAVQAAELDRLTGELESARAERDAQIDRLSSRVANLQSQRGADEAERASLGAELERLNAELDETRERLARATEEVDATAAQLEATRTRLAARSEALAAQESQVAELTAALRAAEAERAAGLERAAALQETLRQERDQASGLAQHAEALTSRPETSQRETRLATAELAAARASLETATDELAQLTEQHERARAELTAARERAAQQADRLAHLTRQGEALAAEVLRLASVLRALDARAQALEDRRPGQAGATSGSQHTDIGRFRSEFFRRLSLLIGDRGDIEVVGDRFVIQAEVLFDSGSADLEASGRKQLAQVARTLTGLAEETPANVDWILRVDGHTDRVPIQTRAFPSNWELSAARAISVVKFLIGQGVPADRLSANGFGPYQPLDDTDSPQAYRRNRRIELKLTGR